MSSYLPTLKQLQYLVALKEQGHFGKAAEACFVTQSTLSAGIRELESLIGVTLVERTRRVVRFTALGDRIVEKAHRVLREAEELAAIAEASGKPLTGELRMSVIPTIAPFLLPRLLPRLRADRPELKLYLREETSQAAIESLRHGNVDCVLLALPFPTGELDSEILFADRLYVAFPQDEPTNPPEWIKPGMIDESKLLLLEDGHCLKDHALAACNRPELRGATSMIGTSLHTLVQMVDNGLGVTMLPEMAVDAGILNGTEVVARPLKSSLASREIALIWRKNSPRRDDFELLAEELRALRQLIRAHRLQRGLGVGAAARPARRPRGRVQAGRRGLGELHAAARGAAPDLPAEETARADSSRSTLDQAINLRKGGSCLEDLLRRLYPRSGRTDRPLDSRNLFRGGGRGLSAPPGRHRLGGYLERHRRPPQVTRQGRRCRLEEISGERLSPGSHVDGAPDIFPSGQTFPFPQVSLVPHGACGLA